MLRPRANFCGWCSGPGQTRSTGPRLARWMHGFRRPRQARTRCRKQGPLCGQAGHTPKACTPSWPLCHPFPFHPLPPLAPCFIHCPIMPNTFHPWCPLVPPVFHPLPPRASQVSLLLLSTAAAANLLLLLLLFKSLPSCTPFNHPIRNQGPPDPPSLAAWENLCFWIPGSQWHGHDVKLARL